MNENLCTFDRCATGHTLQAEHFLEVTMKVHPKTSRVSFGTNVIQLHIIPIHVSTAHNLRTSLTFFLNMHAPEGNGSLIHLVNRVFGKKHSAEYICFQNPSLLTQMHSNRYARI